MRRFTPVNKLTIWLSWLVAAILVLVPFHAFLTVWLSSLVGHYTLLRLWKEFLLVVVVIAAGYLLMTDRSLFKRLISLRMVQLIFAYIVLLLALAFIPLIQHAVTAKAIWYGLLVDVRFLVFFLSVMVIATKSNWLAQRSMKLLFAPAVLVAAFAVLQYLVLPFDFLKHFGYGPNTIKPYEAITHTAKHLRVASTTRGANNLGAYLIVPIAALAVMFFREKIQKLNKGLIAAGLVLALVFSFSRSAWIGAALGILAVALLSIKRGRSRMKIGWLLLGVLLLGAVAAVGLRHSANFQDIFLHTDHTSKVVTSSNEGHISAARSAASDITHKPLGTGVGTAGPQSFYNNSGPRIAENYFLQIGQEAGVIAMVLFVAICVVVGQALYERRADPLALALFASLIGISCVNLLSHAWTDDTLAYIWWGLAAIALSPAILSVRQKAHGKNHKA